MSICSRPQAHAYTTQAVTEDASEITPGDGQRQYTGTATMASQSGAFTGLAFKSMHRYRGSAGQATGGSLPWVELLTERPFPILIDIY